MNQQVDRIKNYEHKLQFTLNKLEPQYRLPTANSINNANQIGILKQSLNNNQNYIQFLESITPQSTKANQFNQTFLIERQNTDQDQMKDNTTLLPQINNPRSKSENKSGAQNYNQINRNYDTDQLKQLPDNIRQSISRNKKRTYNYNFYAQPKNGIEFINTQNEFESTNSSNLWNEIQVKKPNYRYPNTTKYSQSNKITLQQNDNRQLQSRDLIRSLTIDNNNKSSNSKLRNHLDDLSIHNNVVNKLDTSSSQIFNLPLQKHMINIKNIVKNQSLAPISSSNNNYRFQDIQINTNNDNNNNYSHLRLSNQCFSTPHKSKSKDVHSKTTLNKSYDYDLRIQTPSLQKTRTTEKGIQTELKELENQDIKLNENMILNQNTQIQLNRNHLTSSSNRYSKHNYNLISPQKIEQIKNKEDGSQIYLQQQRVATDNDLQSDRVNQNNLSFHHTSVSKNQYLIDERKVVSIQVQNAEMDQYIRQVQKFVFKKQHNIDNNSSLSFKRQHVIHTSDLIQQNISSPVKNNSSDKKLLSNLQQTNSNQDINQNLIENDIHSEQPLIMQQHTFQFKNQDMNKTDNIDQQLSLDKEIKQAEKSSQKQKDSKSNQQSKRSSNDQINSILPQKLGIPDLNKKDQILQNDPNDKKIESQNNQMNESLTRQYSFSACYQENKKIIPYSRNSMQIDQTPKLNSPEKLEIPQQKESQDEKIIEENQKINEEQNTDFFDKKRSAEFGINQNSHKNSQKQIKNSSHQQLNNKISQLEILQDKNQVQNQQSKQQNSSKGLLRNNQFQTQSQSSSSSQSKLSNNQISTNSKQFYQIVNQFSSQISQEQSSLNSYSHSQSKQSSNRLSIYVSNKNSKQNSNNLSPQSYSNRKLLENNQRRSSQEIQQQKINENSSIQKQNLQQQNSQQASNQLNIVQKGNSQQLSKRNSNSSSQRQKYQSASTQQANLSQDEKIYQKNIDKVNVSGQTDLNQIQNENKKIDLDHNQIYLPGGIGGASALESHQTASQNTSKKNSTSQQFNQAMLSNTLRRDPSPQNSDCHPSQYKQEHSLFSSNQNTNRQEFYESEKEQLAKSIRSDQFQKVVENDVHKLELILQNNNKNQKQDMLFYQSQNGFLNHQFYEKERRQQKAQIQKQQKYKKEEMKNDSEEQTIQDQSRIQIKYPNHSGSISKQIFYQDAPLIEKRKSKSKQVEFVSIPTHEQQDENLRKRRFNTAENQARYLRTESQDSSQWLRENIIVKSESPSINQANSTQRSFKSKSKDSTIQSFYQSNMSNIMNIGGSVEDPMKVVKKCNEFKKQGYIKQSYKETQFVSSQKKSNKLTPKKKSINQVSISPTQSHWNSNLNSNKAISPSSKIQNKSDLINSSEISFQSPNKFNTLKQS